MHRIGIAIASLTLLLPLALVAGEAGKLREIDIKGVKLGGKFGKVTTPTIIASADDLAKSPILGGTADKIAKQVDFAKEKLVLFAWGGSGGDRLVAALKDNTATFAYTAGLTRDLRQHVHLFVVPKEAEVKVAKAGR